MTIISGVLMYDKSSWFDSQPKIIPDNGDGTVNVRSLRACLNWQKQQKQPIYHKEFPGVDHMTLLKDAGVLQYLKQVLVGSWWLLTRVIFCIYKSALDLKIVKKKFINLLLDISETWTIGKLNLIIFFWRMGEGEWIWIYYRQF